ncbi:DMT family transporter [Shimazuella sp. AN120528]|uniref:EamA family transporter n=1 Tax=Shimazuella soli TaxID=1892854 RepID=UPI001F0DBDD3|nr:EamA family transporter [Shimazuella soli]MCH5585638.1 DMT family transporter [Shimazuella soli]
MWLFLAFLCFLFNGLSAFFFKINTMKGGTSEKLLFGFYLSGSLGSGLYLLYTQTWDWNWNILVAGSIIGIGTTLGNLLYSKSVYIGPAGLTATVAHSHVILIVFMSIFLYSEFLNWFEGLAILLIIVAILLLPFDPNQKLRIQNNLWYLFVGVAFIGFFIRNGGLKITEEMHLNNNPIIFLSYVFGLIWFSTTLWLGREKKQQVKTTGIFFGIFAGILSFGMMQTLAAALKIGPASIISPIASSNGVIVAGLSYLMYKEKFSKFQFVSFIVLLIGIILINID